MKIDSTVANISQSALQKAGTPFNSNNTITGSIASGDNGNGGSWTSTTLVSSPPESGMRGNVHLSPMSSHLMASASDTSNDIDFARVAALRDAISNGSYRTDSSRIADCMLTSAQELF